MTDWRPYWTGRAFALVKTVCCARWRLLGDELRCRHPTDWYVRAEIFQRAARMEGLDPRGLHGAGMSDLRVACARIAREIRQLRRETDGNRCRR